MDNGDIGERILRFKKAVEGSKSKVSQLEGALSEVSKRLKKEFSVKSLQEAEAELSSIQEKRKDLEGTIRDELEKLEQQFEW